MNGSVTTPNFVYVGHIKCGASTIASSSPKLPPPNPNPGSASELQFVFTARCTLVQSVVGIACRPSVCLSVTLVDHWTMTTWVGNLGN